MLDEALRFGGHPFGGEHPQPRPEQTPISPQNAGDGSAGARRIKRRLVGKADTLPIPEGLLCPAAGRAGGKQIRDVEQAVIGTSAHDLIRLGLSLETAARSSDLPGVTTTQMIEAMINGYTQALGRKDGADPMEPDFVRWARREAMGRSWRHLAKEPLEDVEPKIPLGKRF
jgi:hypothetical protein